MRLSSTTSALLAFLILSPAGLRAADPAGRAGAKPAPAAIPRPAYPDPALLEQLDKEAVQLAKELKELAGQDDDEEFHGELIRKLTEIVHGYRGNPAKVLKHCGSLLESPKIQVRYEVAQAFLTAHTQKEAACRVMRDFLAQDKPQTVTLLDETYDLREGAAMLLAKNEVKEAADDIWKLYQETSEPQLLMALAKLGDRRALNPMKQKMATYPRAVWDSEDLLVALHATEYLDALKAAIPGAPTPKDAAALYRLGGDEANLDFLLEHANQPEIIPLLIEIPSGKCRATFKKLLATDQNSVVREYSFIGLHVQDPNSPEVREMVVDLMKNNAVQPLGLDLVLRVGVDLRDPEIDQLGADYDAKTQEARWYSRLCRRGWDLYQKYPF